MISLGDAEYFYDEIFGILDNGDNSHRKKLIRLYDIFREFTDILLINDSRYFSNYYSMLVYIIDKYSIDKDTTEKILRFRSFASSFKRDSKRKISEKNINFGISALTGFIDFFIDIKGNYDEAAEKIRKFRKRALELDAHLPDFQPRETVTSDFIRAACIDKLTIDSGSGVPEDALLVCTDSNDSIMLLLDDYWREVKQYTKKGSIINLLNVAPVGSKGDYPCYRLTSHSFIIFEPDYLVDVTEIAECFINSGSNKYIYLFSRFMMPESKYSLLKGNIVNSYLDQLVSDIDTAFDDAYEYAVRQKPVSLFALAVNRPHEAQKLKQESESHFLNIRNAIIELGYSDIVIEPTFMSPKFGIQGRLDLLAIDDGGNSKNVIELKSGKAPDKDYSITIGGKLRVKTGVWSNHSAQTSAYNLLLDSAYPDRGGSSGILYSSVEKDNLRNQPNILANKREVIKLRNWLVAIDYALGNDAGLMLRYMLKDTTVSALGGFNAEDLNSFSRGYLGMDDITREYFEKFTAFIAREARTAKAGEGGQNGRACQASLWLMAPEEKANSYNIISGLALDTEKSDFVNYHIAFLRNGENSIISNIRRGDIVIIYPADENYDITGNQVVKGYIKEINNKEILISLRNKQIQKELFSLYDTWAIESDTSDSISKKLYHSLFTFCNANAHKRDIFLGLEEPEFGEVKSHSSNELNSQQNELLGRALASRNYFIIQGPPGTGKTSRMLKTLVGALYSDTDEKILVAAYTNRAVDEICAKLKEIEGLRFLRLGSKESTSHTDVLIASMVEKESPRTVFRKLADARIIVSTVASLIYNPEIFEIIKFDTAIVDEASQILEPYILPVINNTGRVILIGDEKQLPAIVAQDGKYLDSRSEVLSQISMYSLGVSLFERLLANASQKGWSNISGMLEYQARMDYEIQELANFMFYQGRLKSFPAAEDKVEPEYDGSSENHSERALSKSRIVFFDTRLPEGIHQFKHNNAEAGLAADIAQIIYSKYGEDFNEDTLGIIAPFRAQCAEIRSLLPESFRGMVTVDTVERFQGSERENIIISFSVNRQFELKNLSSTVTIDGAEVDRKLNVAITRAKKRLIMIGNAKVLKQSPVYEKMLEYLEFKNSNRL